MKTPPSNTENKPDKSWIAQALKGSTKSENTQAFINAANAQIDVLMKLYEEKKTGTPDWDAFFNSLAVQLSNKNIEQNNGGPFGALIVEYPKYENGKGIGKPIVRGVGANHVFPNSDPSAHAEMEAYRDYAKRNGKTDMKGATLYTSCECCPMCLGIANGAGISRISYVNTRVQADKIAGFSDNSQYKLMASLGLEDMKEADFTNPASLARLVEKLHAHGIIHADKLEPSEKATLEKKLGAHGAMVLDGNGNVVAYGDADTQTDATLLASIQALRAACKKQADEKGEIGQMVLPQDYRLVTRKIPHAAGFITADWAGILRGRDPNDVSKDAETITPEKLIFFEPEFEQVVVRNKDGEQRVPQNTIQTYIEPALPDKERTVPTSRQQGQLASEKRFLDKTTWAAMGGEETLLPSDKDDKTIAAGAAQRVFERWAKVAQRY